MKTPRLIRAMKRGLAAALSACLLLHAGGCASAGRRAVEAWSRLKPGMTRDEVRREIGSPSKTYRIDPVPDVSAQTVEVWLYSYSGEEISAAEIAGAVVLVAAVFAVAVVAAKGGGGGVGGLGGLGGGGGGCGAGCVEDLAHCRFYIGFGADGRVRAASVVEPGR